jgi:hypothetical protein
MDRREYTIRLIPFPSQITTSLTYSISLSDNDLIDMPAGKEKTADLKIPFGIAKESEGR